MKKIFKEVTIFLIGEEDKTGDIIERFSHLDRVPVIEGNDIEKVIGYSENIKTKNKRLVVDIVIPNWDQRMFGTAVPGILTIKNKLKKIGTRQIRYINEASLKLISIGSFLHTQDELTGNLLKKRFIRC